MITLPHGEMTHNQRYIKCKSIVQLDFKTQQVVRTTNKNQKNQLLISQSTQFRSPMIQKPAASSYCWVSPPVVCPPQSLLAAHSSTLNHGCTPTCRHWYSVSLSYSYHHHGHHNCDQLLPVLSIEIPRRHQICTTAIHNIHIWLYII